MSVDWYACPVCGESFNDCGYMVWCDCGRNWCSDECAEKDGFREVEKLSGDEKSCKFCREEDVEDSALLEYCLLRLDISRSDASAMFYEDKHGGL